MSKTWIGLLRAEARRTSISAAARRIGYSRPAVSGVLAGRYHGDTSRIAARVLAVLGGMILCPHTEAEMKLDACRRWRARPMPLGSAADLRHWRACRACRAWKDMEEKANETV
jgi:hypothetical protein